MKKMNTLQDFKQLSEVEWEIPQEGAMQVSVRVIANQEILQDALADESFQQARSAAALPGVVGNVMVMPDVHQGYGFPIGGVAAMDYETGVISPGAIGYDINCGVRLLASQIPYTEAKRWMDDLLLALDQACPSGMRRKSQFPINLKQLDQILEQGSFWLKKNGQASPQDIAHTESNGCLRFANPDAVSERAKLRGVDQLGTLGSGNHFLEVGIVDEIFDEEAAAMMGLVKGNLTVMIHCGSRGLGHQVCGDALQILQQSMQKEHIIPPNRDLSYAYIQSKEGQSYLGAMGAAANFAFANRQALAYQVSQVFDDVLAGKVKRRELNLVYDVAHNMGNIEMHQVQGKEVRVCVHRKGATRAFGPGSADIPDLYQKIGQPVLVPGSMGTSSWVLTGTREAMQKSFGSSCHGAGRTLSRQKAKKLVDGRGLIQELGKHGVLVRTASIQGLAEEAPQAYKDVDAVVESVTTAGIAHRVARLLPLAVIKG
jgi:tRNA-splicing ligase RtcB